MLSRSNGHRLRLPLGAALLALVALCATAALALAGQPVAGAHYKGHIGNYHYNTPISFRVNDKGTKVKDLITFDEPVFNYPACVQESRGHTTATADISDKGKFKTVVKYAAGTTTILGEAVITGKFHSDGTERGVLTFTSFENPDCNGAADYSTKAH